MNLFSKSIVSKLWLTMVVLVLINTWITVLVQSNIIRGVYVTANLAQKVKHGLGGFFGALFS